MQTSTYGDNSNITNPNNDLYWKSRGYVKRPQNWKEVISKDEHNGSIVSRRSQKRELNTLFPLNDVNFMCKDDY